MGPDVAQQDVVPELFFNHFYTGMVILVATIADIKVVGDFENVPKYTTKAFPFEVEVEVLKDFFLTEVPVQVRFFPLINTSIQPIQVLSIRQVVLGADEEVNPFVVVGAKVSVELDIWFKIPVIWTVVFNVGLLWLEASIAKCSS